MRRSITLRHTPRTAPGVRRSALLTWSWEWPRALINQRLVKFTADWQRPFLTLASTQSVRKSNDTSECIQGWYRFPETPSEATTEEPVVPCASSCGRHPSQNRGQRYCSWLSLHRPLLYHSTSCSRAGQLSLSHRAVAPEVFSNASYQRVCILHSAPGRSGHSRAAPTDRGRLILSRIDGLQRGCVSAPDRRGPAGRPTGAAQRAVSRTGCQSHMTAPN